MAQNRDTWGQVAPDPLVAAARRVADEVLAPSAQQVDRTVVPPEHLRALAAEQLLAPTAPPELGGGGASAAVGREVAEVLAGACGATWFVTTQHHLPVRSLLTSTNASLQQRWLRPLASGEVMAGIALAHLRRPGAPVNGRPVADGWRVSGVLPWLTSWGLAELVLLGFRDGDDVVFALVPAREQPGFLAGPPLELAAMQAARTVTVTLQDYPVAAEDVVDRQPYEEWARRDAATTANATPAVFGLLLAVVARMQDEGERRDEAATTALAERLASDASAVRAQAYSLVDVPADEGVDDRLALRAAALDLLTTATTGLVAAGAGASMSLDHPAQRWAREALFHLIQAQTPAVRAATLGRLSRRLTAEGGR
jgi:alkylation response protein AidB-like acyl-CoA dehydrogenase